MFRAALLVLASVSVATAEIVLHPPPEGIAASDQYEVEVRIDGRWQPSHVHLDRARTDGLGATDLPGRTFSWTTFSTDEPVRVRVTRREGGFGEAIVRPLRHGIAPEKVDDRTVEFSVEPGMKVSVEFDTELRENCFTGPPHGLTCIVDSMMVFADRRRERHALDGIDPEMVHRPPPGRHMKPVAVGGLPGITAGRSTLGDADGRPVVAFGPGVYDIGYWQVPNGIRHLHFEPGSLVFGAIDVIPQGREPWTDDLGAARPDRWTEETLRPSFRITGPGILSGARLPWHLRKDFTYTQHDEWWAHVKLVQLAVEEIVVEDVTLVNSPYWVLSFLNDADPRSGGRFENFKIVGGWTYNSDGLPVGRNSVVRDAFIHADDDAFKLYHDGGRVERCVVWQGNNGAVFQFGWFPKSVSGVRVDTVDVIHFENWYGVDQSNRAVFNHADTRGPGLIEDIRFENVAVEGRVLRLFGFKAAGGQRFRDFRFVDLRCGGMGVGQLGAPGRNYFIGDARDFRFENFRFDGARVTRPEEARFDFAEGAGEGFEFVVEDE